MVVVQQSTDLLTSMDLSIRVRGWGWPFQQLVVESLVVSLAMVVLDVLLDDEA